MRTVISLLLAFLLTGTAHAGQLLSYSVDTPIETTKGAIEVTITLKDGRKRWCWFAEPARLPLIGDAVPDTDAHALYAAPQMILVSRIDPEIIEKTLRHLDEIGELVRATKPVK